MSVSLPDAVLTEARTWLGTPYQHQASVKQAGCDCLGLVRGVWRALYGDEPLGMPAYTPDWAERHERETLMEAADHCLISIALSEAVCGDVILFRMAPDAPAKHVAILSGPERMIHAYWGRAVVETVMIPYWKRRRAFAYRFPNPPT